MEVLFITENRYPWCKQAKEYLDTVFGEKNVTVRTSVQKYSAPPDDLIDGAKDLLISALNPWIIPKRVLDAHELAINFHPGPPAYPGTAGYNFAIYDGVKEYGATCHIMDEFVDAGPILRTTMFPVYGCDTPRSLQQRTHTYMLAMFYEVVTEVSHHVASAVYSGYDMRLQCSSEKWARKAYTRHDFESLCRITPDMGDEEIARRIRATSYPDRPGAFVEMGKHIFEHTDKDRTKFE